MDDPCAWWLSWVLQALKGQDVNEMEEVDSSRLMKLWTRKQIKDNNELTLL